MHVLEAVPADFHVHTQWSWDAPGGAMEESCRRAQEMGLPAIAFTDHADFTDHVRGRDGLLDVVGYLGCIEECRARFPGLRILSGVELGEPHRFVAESAAIRSAGPLDRVLGSVHCIEWENQLVDMSTPGFLGAQGPARVMRAFLNETLALVRGDDHFQVLAHLDYPKRYWPHGEVEFVEADFEEEFRSVLLELAAQGRVLELNTTRGVDPRRGLCPGPEVLRWWRECGGAAVSLGSDAHSPENIARGFALAGEAIEAAGFRRPAGPADFWTL